RDDVRHRVPRAADAPVQDAVRRFHPELRDRGGHLALVLRVMARLQRGDAGVEQRERRAELLVPLAPGLLRVAVPDLLRREAGERRAVGIRWRPVRAARETRAELADRRDL